jgi:cyclopentanol dehydrogenase
MRLQDKVVVITGAASGIGASAARLFAREGGLVVATDIQLRGVEAVVADIVASGGRAIAVGHNVASDSDWTNVVERAMGEFGRIDALVNNAGVADRTSIQESTAETTDEDDWARVIDINLKSVFLGIKRVLPAMKDAGGGSIINVSSVAALVGNAGPFAYSAAKGGVRSMTKHVAYHYGRFNIRANSIHPGGVKTPMIAADNAENENLAKMIISTIPLGRISDPAEIANLALFLASDESSYLTGAELVADGGLTIS